MAERQNLRSFPSLALKRGTYSAGLTSPRPVQKVCTAFLNSWRASKAGRLRRELRLFGGRAQPQRVADNVQRSGSGAGNRAWRRLLNHTTRRGLTEVGREYYERCSQILHELQEADEVASALQMTPRGRLRVYCHQGLTRFIALVVNGFLEDYPEMSLDLRSGDALDKIPVILQRRQAPAGPVARRLPGRRALRGKVDRLHRARRSGRDFRS